MKIKKRLTKQYITLLKVKKIINVVTCCLLTVSLFLPNLNAFAEESKEENEMNQSSLIQPRWWPGNPNPQPGTEDWLYQNYSPNLGSSASSSVAEDCSLSALIGGGVSVTSNTLKNFISGKKYTLAIFITYFGVGYAEGYAACLIYNGIKN